MEQNNGTVRLTGAWERSGSYGTFNVGKVTLTELNEALSKLGNPDNFEIVISPVQQKKSDSSPDFNINLRLPVVKNAGGNKGTAPAAASTGGGFTGAVKGAAKSYGKRA